MPIYSCDLCDFNSTNKMNYSKHISTKKHLEKVNDSGHFSPRLPKTPQNSHTKDNHITNCDTQTSVKVYICTNCNNSFTRMSNLTRHKKVCVELNQEIKDIEKENEILKKEITQLKANEKLFKQQLTKTEKNYKKQIESYERLLSSAVGPKTITNYNYIVNNYQNAPALECKKSYANLLETDTTTLVDLIIMYYEQNRLVNFIGDYLIKEYLNEEPEKQSLWTTDLSRLTYIISQAHKKGSSWGYDKKGVKIKKIIIEPVLEYIRNDLAKYNEENSGSKKSSVLKKMMTINNIVPDIDGNILVEKINKYISPKFMVKQSDTESLAIVMVD
jgi:hypothetical protein